jgi:hypothetical protein
LKTRRKHQYQSKTCRKNTNTGEILSKTPMAAEMPPGNANTDQVNPVQFLLGLELAQVKKICV